MKVYKLPIGRHYILEHLDILYEFWGNPATVDQAIVDQCTPFEGEYIQAARDAVKHAKLIEDYPL